MAQEKSSNFSPFVVRTKNIAKELVSAAGNHGVKASKLDFNLLSVQTYLGVKDSKDEPEEVFGEELEKLEDESVLGDEKVEITQSYEVEIIEAREDDHFAKLALSIGANPSMTRLFASIKAGSTLKYYEGIEEDLYVFINKRKLRANMLINIWEKNLKDEIAKFIAKVRVADTLHIDKRISFEVARSLDAVETIDDELILHYQKEEQDESDKVDHVNRGYVQGVVKGDLLIEYVKPRRGVSGRNCRGEFIAPTEPVVSKAPTFNVSDNIEVVETEENIEYRAKTGGYITFEGGVYDIRVEVEVSEINFKTTGSIEAGIDSDVVINVKEADPFKDAIGQGMEVEAKEINVDGNIGNNTKLKARKIVIGGLTHQSSFVEGDEVQIKIHKGTVKGKTVKIERLEQGIVEAERVEIAQASGGKIIAQEVVIDTLASHVEIIASKMIEITHFKGEENSFTISPVLFEEEKESLSGNEEESIVQKRKIRAIEEEITEKKKTLADNASSIIDLKKRLAQYKKSGAKMPSSFVSKFKEFQGLQQRITILQKELNQNKEKLELILSQATSLQGDILDAKIINKDTYKGHNEIRFKLLEPAVELYHVPKGGAGEKCFVLEQDEESGEYKIVGKQEIS